MRLWCVFGIETSNDCRRNKIESDTVLDLKDLRTVTTLEECVIVSRKGCEDVL